MSKVVVVLLSGGIDSAVLMYSLIADYEVHPLTIDYAQRHRKEINAAKALCEARGDWLLARWRLLNLRVLGELLPSALTDAMREVPSGSYDKETMSQTVVPNRNMIFLSVAAGYALGIGAGYVAYAAHAEDHYLYPDCRPEFVRSVSKTIKLGTDGAVELLEPFVFMSKTEIVRLGKKLNVPFKLCWSCYEGKTVPCGKCGTCIERAKAFELAGFPDPALGGN